MLLSDGDRVGAYDVISAIGQGGMGEVYRARDTRLGRLVALKVLPSEVAEDAERKRRFLNEARAASAINHPNVAHLYEFGETGAMSFIAMELVEGASLAEKLRQGPLSLEEIVGIGSAVAEALTEAHARGIVHRDIKPANVMLTRGGDVKVLDFGLAKMQGSDDVLSVDGTTAVQTTPGTIMGTVHYLSPEQATGRVAGPSTDIFALGVLLYEIATGQTPFSGGTMMDVMDKLLRSDPVPMSVHRNDLPLGLQRIVTRCLQKDPAQRYARASEIARELRELRNAEYRETTTIAVLPFEDLSPGHDNQYFSDGLTDEITSDLAAIDDIAVVSRRTASSYRNAQKDVKLIARELSVRYILEGTVRKATSELRITVRLIDALNDTSVWTGKFGGTIEDVFQIQEKVAREVVAALRPMIGRGEDDTIRRHPTFDAAAFDSCLRGQYLVLSRTRRDLEAAIRAFEEAMRRDPAYPDAHAGLAEACTAYYENYDRSNDWIDRAMEEAVSAVLYGPDRALGYSALAGVYFSKRKLAEALTACERAIAIAPHDYHGYYVKARIHHLVGQGQRSVDLLKKAIALNEEFYPAYFLLRMVTETLGCPEEYRPYLDKLIGQVFPAYLARHPGDARAINSFGMELSHAGRLEEGRREVERALAAAHDDPMILYCTACYYALWDDPKVAIQTLRRAIDEGWRDLDYLRADPDLRVLHGDPSYDELLRDS